MADEQDRSIALKSQLFNLSDLRNSLCFGQRLLGIDPGSKTVGLALSDKSLLIASPYLQLKREKLSVFAEKIKQIARKEEVGGLVVGLPLLLSGEVGPAAQAAQDWAKDLSILTDLPAVFWDERFTSSLANRLLIREADLSRKRRAELVDRTAAALMLQGALDATAHLRFREERLSENPPEDRKD